MKLGDLIIKYREDNKLSQREFARRADLSNSLISIIERGYNPQTGKEMSPDLETYQRIAAAMGMTVQALFETLGDDASVKISPAQYRTDTDNYTDESDDVRLLIQNIRQFNPEEVQQVKAMMKIMFAKTRPNLFEKGTNDENHT